MIYEVNATDLGTKTVNYINKVRYGHDTCIIKHGTEEIGALISIELFNRLKRLEHDFKDVRTKMMVLGQSMTDEEAEQLANKAVKFARGKK